MLYMPHSTRWRYYYYYARYAIPAARCAVDADGAMRMRRHARYALMLRC